MTIVNEADEIIESTTGQPIKSVYIGDYLYHYKFVLHKVRGLLELIEQSNRLWKKLEPESRIGVLTPEHLISDIKEIIK